MADCYLHSPGIRLGERRPLDDLRGRVDPELIDALGGDGLTSFREAAEPCAHLAADALDASLRASGLAPADIELIIYSSLTVAQEPFEQVCGRGVFGRTPVLSLMAGGCAGGSAALRCARALLAREGLKHVAIVTADSAGPGSPRLTRMASAVLSDAAAAAIVTAEPRGWRLESCVQRDDHRIRAMERPDQAPLRSALAVRGLRQVVEDALAEAAVGQDDIGTILASNLRRSLLTHYLRAAALPAEHLYVETREDIGHAYSADPLINLAHFQAAAGAAADQRLLLLLGMSFNSWGAAVIRPVAGAG
jgi:3-oxoacyl-[acyl-carrier-protein] synthase III